MTKKKTKKRFILISVFDAEEQPKYLEEIDGIGPEERYSYLQELKQEKKIPLVEYGVKTQKAVLDALLGKK